MPCEDEKDRPRIRKINEIREESSNIKTFRLFDPPSGRSEPGQFAMIWVPGEGEAPFSFSLTEGNMVEFTVKKVGPVTEEMHGLNPGDRVGVRGPYGSGFSPPDGSCLLVGGGCGIIPLRHFFHYYHQADTEILFGAESSEELIFKDELTSVEFATDDGSFGFHGPVTDLFERVIDDGKPDAVLSAGPEPMLYDLFQVCRKEEISFQASLERIMKCGVGLCGSCLIDEFRVCKDGPVADKQKLEELEEFGQWKRKESGKREEA